MAFGRVHDHPGWLVHDREMFVLEEDIQRNGFGFGPVFPRGLNASHNAFATAKSIGGLGPFPVNFHLPGLDAPANRGPAVLWQMQCQERVQTLVR